MVLMVLEDLRRMMLARLAPEVLMVLMVLEDLRRMMLARLARLEW
jgi:hypothetical protein